MKHHDGSDSARRYFQALVAASLTAQRANASTPHVGRDYARRAGERRGEQPAPWLLGVAGRRSIGRA